MAVKCMHWSQPIVPHSPSSSQSLASLSSKRKSRRGDGGALVFRYLPGLDRSALFGAPLQRSRSCGYSKSRTRTIKRACSATLDAFSDDEFSKKIQELAVRFQFSDDNGNGNDKINQVTDSESEFRKNRVINGASSSSGFGNSSINFEQNHHRHKQFPNSELGSMELPWPEIHQEPPDWAARDEIIPASIEMKANSVDLPLSLRIIQKKMQWEDGFREAGESACCSVKKAFSSMVFIIRELQSFTLQMREFLYYEDLQGILVRVQKELHASFVWLFQQVFSQTPTLMVYVMILLANFTVHSMACNASIVASPPPISYSFTTESVSVIENTDDQSHRQFDSSSIKTFSVSSGKTAAVGGNSGGGGKFRPNASGTDGEGRFNRADKNGTYGALQFSPSESVLREEEAALWNSIVEEAAKLQAMVRDEALDHDTVQRFVSPVTAKIESDDDYVEYFKTELIYQSGLSEDPNNSLLLANYAQFLYLVAHDYDRADEYFKRATKVEPPDAEAFYKYAKFLWKARSETWAAEETYLEAISAHPGSYFYAGEYANFLWNTGGEDTCTCFDHDMEDA